MTNSNQNNPAVVASSALGQTHLARAKKYHRRNRYRSVLSHRPHASKGSSIKIWWRVKYNVPSVEYTSLYKEMFNSVENILYVMGHNKEDILSVTKTGYLWLDLLSGVTFFNQLIKNLSNDKFEVGFLRY